MRRSLAVWGVVALLVGWLGMPSTASAATVTDRLVDLLVKKGIVSSMEANELRSELSNEQARADKELPKRIDVEHVQKMKWFGDFRLRHEMQNRTLQTTRNRERFRFRVGFKADINEKLKGQFRLASGATTEGTSTNQSFTDSFFKKSITIDQAYLTYTPLTGVEVVGGKYDVPFFANTIKENTIWDGDVTAEGASIKLSKKFGENSWTPHFMVGAFALDESGTESEDPGLFSGEAGLEIDPWVDAENPFRDAFKINTAVAYHDYTNVQGKTLDAGLLGNRGLGSSTTIYRYDYDILNITAKLSSALESVPVALVGDFSDNTNAPDEDRAWMGGVELGATKNPGDLMLAAYAKKLERDAVLGAFSDSDFGGGGTNHQGFAALAAYQVAKNATVSAKWFDTDQSNGSKVNNDTLQLDAVVKW